MTNFDYLKKEPKFNTFSDAAIAAEKILYIDAMLMDAGWKEGSDWRSRIIGYAE